MHAYLLIGKSAEKIKKEIDSLCKKFQSQVSEYEIAKIEDIRELSRFTKLAFTQPHTIIINNIDKASLEALNAFLKNLEEPQENISYILTAKRLGKVIPTIISRCQVIRVDGKNETAVNVVDEAQQFLHLSVIDKIVRIESIKQREEAVFFLENLILGWHSELLQDFGQRLTLAKALERAQKTLDAIEANGNVGLQITNFVINL